MAAPTRVAYANDSTGAINSDTLVFDMSTIRASAQVGDVVAVFCSSDGVQTQSVKTGTDWSYITQFTDAAGTQLNFAFFEFLVTVAGTVPDLEIELGATTEMAIADAILIRPSSGATLHRLGPSGTGATSTNPDPPSQSNSSGGTIDAYVIAACAGDLNTANSDVTAAPSGYGNFQAHRVNNTQGVLVGTADKTITAMANGASEDPGAFTKAASEQWAAMTAIYYETGGGSDQDLTASLVSNSQTFFAPVVALALVASLFSNTQTFFAPAVTPAAASITAPLVSNDQTFHAPQLDLNLVAPLYSNSQTFYGPTVSPGASNLTAPLFTNSQTFYAPTVSLAAQQLTASLLTNTQTFYGPQMDINIVVPLVGAAVAAVTVVVFRASRTSQPEQLSVPLIRPPLLNSGNTFYGPTVIRVGLLSASLLSNTQTFYSPTIVSGANLAAPLVSNSQTFYAPTASQDGLALVAPLYSNSQAFYAPTASLNLVSAKHANSQTFFGPTLSTGPTPGQILSAPTVTITSAEGADLEIDCSMGADIYAGFRCRIQRSEDGVKNASDGTYVTKALDITHMVRPQEVAALAITNADLAPDGYYSPTGSGFQQYRWEREDGAISAWAEIEYDVTDSVAALSLVTGPNKSQYVDVTGLSFVSDTNTSSLQGVRSPQEAVNDKFHFEVEITALNATGRIYIGITDGTHAIGPATGLTTPGASGGPGCCYRANATGNGTIFRNAGSVGTSEGAAQVGDILICEGDRTANTVKFYRRRSGVNTQVGSTITMTTGIPANWHAFVGTFRSADAGTVNFGASAFAMTPSTGYDFYA